MLEEKIVRRGEVWWVNSGATVGQEQAFGRPGVVISSDAGNETCPTVMVAYTTTQSKAYPFHTKVSMKGKPSRVLCTCVDTVDKSRLDRKIGTLTAPEMIRVGGGLAIAQAIPQYPSKPAVETSQTKEDVALRCERDMWRRMYETVLDQLVEMRVNQDLTPRPPVVEMLPVIEEETPVAPVVEVDINHCDDQALMELGLTPADCDSIIACRPFESVLELNCVPDLDTKWVAANEHRLICTPLVDKGVKVNLNLCAAKDLMRVGIAKGTAYKITSHRKRFGAFTAVEDLTKVHGVGQGTVDKFKDVLEV